MAAAADRLRHLETGDADIGKPIAAAPCDPAGPPALPAWPLRAVLAAGTYRPVVLVPTCDRSDDSAAPAGHGQLAAPAPWAHPTAVRTGQRAAAACAYRARRLGQRRASLAQLVYQPTHHRRRT